MTYAIIAVIAISFIVTIAGMVAVISAEKFMDLQ